jgi:hypothetical protein
MPSDAAREVARQVREDVARRLGPFFVEDEDDDVPSGFTTTSTFGDDGVVEGASETGSAFTFVRWQWRGRHEGSIPTQDGPDLVGPTGNPVLVEGLTVVEARDDGEFRARWFVDWLSVYAQLGLVMAGRPTRMENIEVRDAIEARRSG